MTGAAQHIAAEQAAPAISASGLEVCANDGTQILSDISFALMPGRLTVLVGPNGAGKTSLIRALAGHTEASGAYMTGSVTIDSEDLSAFSPVQRARRIAMIAQHHTLAWPQPVADIVALGRFAYGARPGRLGTSDQAAIERAIEQCSLKGLRERAADTLSGGEQARMHIARALCAETPILLADEPAASLDPRAAHEIMRLFRSTARERGAAVLASVHDLQLAASYADRILWLCGGRLVADGTAQDTITAERLRDIFGIDGALHLDARSAPSVHIHGPA